MRNQFVQTVIDLMDKDDRIVLLLGDIGKWQFMPVVLKYPDRLVNCGISEQAMIGMASGLAKEGLIPIVYAIAPFMVERAYEQIKLDLSYNRLKAILISVGGSFDYHNEGSTHHCPGDVALLYQIPRMNIYLPADKITLDRLIRYAVKSEESRSYYIRLPLKHCNTPTMKILCEGDPIFTAVTIGDAIVNAKEAFKDWPVDIFHFDTVVPFIAAKLLEIRTNVIVLIEPYYPVLPEVVREWLPRSAVLVSIGVSKSFVKESGTLEDVENRAGIGVNAIKERCEVFLK